MSLEINRFKNWIFDMDGTLTIACHDFNAIRRQLGMPADMPILEEIGKQPPARAAELHRRLYDIELKLAHQARPQPGIARLLEKLKLSGCKLGVITRNDLAIAHATLQACGLDAYFQDDDILGRDCCAPKPSPDGVLHLMNRWSAAPDVTVMVGDYWFDLQSGFDAGIKTIHFSVDGSTAWPAVTHLTISSFFQVADLIVQ